MAVERGCGTRQAAGIYISCPLSPFGVPLENFFIDPPIHQVDIEGEMVPIMQAWKLASLGIRVMEVPQAGPGYHVVDVVGLTGYLNTADILEEARRYGVSRRASEITDFSLLDERSKILLLHPYGFIEEYEDYAEEEPITAHDFRPCPKWREDHALKKPQTSMCVRFWYQDLQEGFKDEELPEKQRDVVRYMPSFRYHGFEPPQEITTTRKPALIAGFPIWQFEVITDHEGGKHKEALDAARQSPLPVFEMEE